MDLFLDVLRSLLAAPVAVEIDPPESGGSQHLVDVASGIEAEGMETHVLLVRPGHCSFDDHPPRGAIERAALNNRRLANRKPFLLLEPGHDALAVDHLEDKATSRHQHAGRSPDHLAVVRLIGEVAEAREQVEHDVERLTRNRPAHVRREPSNSDATRPPPFRRHREEVGRKVGPGDVVAAAGELDRMPALAARQIENALRRPKRQQGFEPIDLDRRAFGQILVVEGQVAGPEPAPPPL